CYDPLEKEEHITLTNCSHVFHTFCLYKWWKSEFELKKRAEYTCSMCRESVCVLDSTIVFDNRRRKAFDERIEAEEEQQEKDRIECVNRFNRSNPIVLDHDTSNPIVLDHDTQSNDSD
ncbi:MAG: RING finger protein, partial [Candidatus Fonsibacter sp.]